MAGGVYGVVVDILPSRAAILKFLEGRMVLQPASATPAFQSTNPISPMPMHRSSCLHELYDANILTPRFYTPATDRCEHRPPSLRVYASLSLLSLGLLESIDDLRLDDFPPLNLRYDTSERKNQHPNSRMQQISPFHSSLVWIPPSTSRSIRPYPVFRAHPFCSSTSLCASIGTCADLSLLFSI